MAFIYRPRVAHAGVEAARARTGVSFQLPKPTLIQERRCAVRSAGQNIRNGTQLRAAGETILKGTCTNSPLMYQHVIRTGTYHFARSKPGDDIA
jgi:hypothetical protein